MNQEEVAMEPHSKQGVPANHGFDTMPSHINIEYRGLARVDTSSPGINKRENE